MSAVKARLTRKMMPHLDRRFKKEEHLITPYKRTKCIAPSCDSKANIYYGSFCETCFKKANPSAIACIKYNMQKAISKIIVGEIAEGKNASEYLKLYYNDGTFVGFALFAELRDYPGALCGNAKNEMEKYSQMLIRNCIKKQQMC